MIKKCLYLPPALLNVTPFSPVICPSRWSLSDWPTVCLDPLRPINPGASISGNYFLSLLSFRCEERCVTCNSETRLRAGLSSYPSVTQIKSPGMSI
ncbi:hypothetical protein CDAR_106291 [Caerostris darwini]|uniref:Uncharacterized protein n=1 Tax=Caerostris darwini TaxID=1538125 RepID=A0AAV4SJH9_9ARAC|nr:hypothetical protein CDAR_106291 [Caerostris darwini]